MVDVVAVCDVSVVSLEPVVSVAVVSVVPVAAGSGDAVSLGGVCCNAVSVTGGVSGFFSLPDAVGTVRFAFEVDGVVRRTEWVVL